MEEQVIDTNPFAIVPFKKRNQTLIKSTIQSLPTINSFPTIAREISLEIPGSSITLIHERSVRLNLKVGALTLFFDDYRKHLRVIPLWGRIGSAYNFKAPEAVHSISLNYSRDPKHLARDIMNRILKKGYERIYPETLANVEKYEATERKDLNGLQQICDIIDGRKQYETVYSDMVRVQRELGKYLFSDIRLPLEESKKLAKFLKSLHLNYKAPGTSESRVFER